MRIAVTGGAGYIGSHTIVELLNSGYEVVSVDNFCNSSPKVNDRIRRITGKDFDFVRADAADPAAMSDVFARYPSGCVIHFAAYKSPAESVADPLKYYRNNLDSLLTVCETMRKAGCEKLVFSSSATVYGDPASVPVREDFPLGAINPYGQTKLMAERILRDLAASDPRMSVALLRYFNPIGAHESGLIGEDPNDIPNNLLPRVAQVAAGLRDCLPVNGNDYDTPDGTGVRDYIHVVDLARGHVCAIKKLCSGSGVFTYNLGTGRGASVLEVISAMERACGHPIKHAFAPRRPGDCARCYCDPSKAERELGWKAEYGIDRACRDYWRWQTYGAKL